VRRGTGRRRAVSAAKARARPGHNIAAAATAAAGLYRHIAEYGPRVVERLVELQRPSPVQTPDCMPVEIAAVR